MAILFLFDAWMTPNILVTGFKYYVLFKDYYSQYSWISPMHNKSDAFSHFKSLYLMVSNIFNISITFFQSDNGTEYANHIFRDFSISMALYIVSLVPTLCN